MGFFVFAFVGLIVLMIRDRLAMNKKKAIEAGLDGKNLAIKKNQ